MQPADAVELGDAAVRLESALAAGAAPDVRGERVAALRSAIVSGSYTIDSQKLARALLDRP